MQTCLNILGAKPVNGTHMVGDKRCYAAPCSDSSKVCTRPGDSATGNQTIEGFTVSGLWESRDIFATR